MLGVEALVSGCFFTIMLTVSVALPCQKGLYLFFLQPPLAGALGVPEWPSPPALLPAQNSASYWLLP